MGFPTLRKSGTHIGLLWFTRLNSLAVLHRSIRFEGILPSACHIDCVMWRWWQKWSESIGGGVKSLKCYAYMLQRLFYITNRPTIVFPLLRKKWSHSPSLQRKNIRSGAQSPSSFYNYVTAVCICYCVGLFIYWQNNYNFPTKDVYHRSEIYNYPFIKKFILPDIRILIYLLPLASKHVIRQLQFNKNEAKAVARQRPAGNNGSTVGSGVFYVAHSKTISHYWPTEFSSVQIQYTWQGQTCS
jgi:hypothetical protein